MHQPRSIPNDQGRLFAVVLCIRFQTIKLLCQFLKPRALERDPHRHFRRIFTATRQLDRLTSYGGYVIKGNPPRLRRNRRFIPTKQTVFRLFFLVLAIHQYGARARGCPRPSHCCRAGAHARTRSGAGSRSSRPPSRPAKIRTDRTPFLHEASCFFHRANDLVCGHVAETLRCSAQQDATNIYLLKKSYHFY